MNRKITDSDHKKRWGEIAPGDTLHEPDLSPPPPSVEVEKEPTNDKPSEEKSS